MGFRVGDGVQRLVWWPEMGTYVFRGAQRRSEMSVEGVGDRAERLAWEPAIEANVLRWYHRVQQTGIVHEMGFNALCVLMIGSDNISVWMVPTFPIGPNDRLKRLSRGSAIESNVLPGNWRPGPTSSVGTIECNKQGSCTKWVSTPCAC